MAAVLTAASLDFVQQFMHETCRGKSRRLPFDFAIPSLRILIEFDGVHHREPVRWAYSITEERAQEILKHRQFLDCVKTQWAANNGWTLVRLTDKASVEDDLRAHGIITKAQMAQLEDAFEAPEDQDDIATRRAAIKDPMADLMGDSGYDENGRPLKGAALAASQSRQLSGMAGRG
ncbi:hypothetical protein IV500_05380 [Paeniglutamicibacter antarcticus]|uniref:DUF559 domain-containing protein n=1 Tax=Arthrobacter terrae TaxID=2935737 RepID=A0A931G9N2_9MICC|nr:hypothetical protein [Arthrobacter terrae]MBG0738852.1 hypothetical protein [Arthrobacter terrae]